MQTTRGSAFGGTGLRRAFLPGCRPVALFRLLLLALSMAGAGAALVCLLAGHANLAARILAGDVLLIFAILLIA